MEEDKVSESVENIAEDAIVEDTFLQHSPPEHTQFPAPANVAHNVDNQLIDDPEQNPSIQNKLKTVKTFIGNLRHRKLTLIIILLVITLTVVFFNAWGDDDTVQLSSNVPVLVNEDNIKDFARQVDLPVYWAGNKENTVLELTQVLASDNTSSTDSGSETPTASEQITPTQEIHIRYLTEGARLGDRRQDFLTVSVYAQPNAYEYTQTLVRGGNWRSKSAPGGGRIVYSPEINSVYLAYPNANYLVEVYSPNNDGINLVQSNMIKTVN